MLIRRFATFARQEHAERALDGAGAGARDGLATVGPGLRSLEPRAPPHEGAAVGRLVLPATALPGALQAEIGTVERAGTLLSHALCRLAQPHHMGVAHRAARDRDIDRF